MSSFKDFLVWEATTRDTIDFKKVYVDMADDLIAGLMLSQIVYWYLPNADGGSKLRVRKDGHLWIAKKYSEWYDEIRITDRQAMRALKILADKKLILVSLYRFDGAPTTHIRLNEKAFMEAWEAQSQKVFTQSVNSNLRKPSNPNDTKCKFQSTQSVETITENTAKNTTERGKAPSIPSDNGRATKGDIMASVHLTGDPYLDAAARKHNNQEAGRAVYGRQIKMVEWNRELPIAQRGPIATAIAEVTGKRPLWDAGDEKIHDELHQNAITAYRMGYETPESITTLTDKWRADWRGSNGGSIGQFLTFLSEQKTQAKKAQPKKKVVYRPVEGDM